MKKKEGRQKYEEDRRKRYCTATVNKKEEETMKMYVRRARLPHVPVTAAEL